MIKNISLHNFQSHKDTVIDFHPGVNVITGNSDCGKSAIMRGLIWAIKNNPTGDAFVSTWARDKKGKQKQDCCVTIDSVERKRGTDFNGYSHDGNTYEALRGEVPEAISKHFKILDVNIQRQLDGPFMLSNTPGENSKLVNELVNLTDIDVATSWLNSCQRDCSTKAKFLSSEIENLNKQVKDSGAVDNLAVEIERIGSIGDTISDKEEVVRNTVSLIDEYSSLKVCDTGILEEELKKLEYITNKGKEIASIVKRTEESLATYDSFIGSVIDISKIPDTKKIERLGKMLEEIEKLEKETSDSVAEYERTISENSEREKDITSLTDELSTMACPMCGRIGKFCQH